MSKAKILIVDIETFPNLSYTWGKYEQNVIRFKQESCIATYAAKWLGKPVFAKGLNSYENYVPGTYDDMELVTDLHALFDKADIIVAHNGIDFDIKVCQSRFIFHGLKPPAPFKVVDTKRVAKRVGRFNSNKLDDLGELLDLGRKIKTDFDLWQGCINGDKKAWAKMLKYNKKDVVLLEKLYLRLLPWMSTHPNRGLLENATCPKCGRNDAHSRGEYLTTTRRYQRFQWQSCGGWFRTNKSTGKVVTSNA